MDAIVEAVVLTTILSRNLSCRQKEILRDKVVRHRKTKILSAKQAIVCVISRLFAFLASKDGFTRIDSLDLNQTKS